MRFFFCDVLVGFFVLHALLDAIEVFFVLDVGFLYVVELLFAGLIGLIAVRLKEIFVLIF